MTNEFQSRVYGSNIAEPTLPLVHVTDSYTFNEILSFAKPSLNPKECKVYLHQNLLYFFYGRVSYRVNPNDPLIEEANAPIVLLTNGSAKYSTKRVMPFDSGAFANKKFTNKLKKTTLNDFELEGKIDNAKKVVDCFFENNPNYLSAKCREGMSFPRSEKLSKAYFGLISSLPAKKYDDRACAIEIQVFEKVSLDKDYLFGVIAPEIYKGLPELDGLIKRANGAVRFYRVDRGTTTNEYLMTLRGYALELMKEKGISV